MLCKVNNLSSFIECNVVIAFQGTSREVSEVENHRVVLSGLVEGAKSMQ